MALNEVGGDPGRFGLSPEEFHQDNELIARHWPGTLLATSTHDTKRSEDIRARIALLSEIPTRFAESGGGLVPAGTSGTGPTRRCPTATPSGCSTRRWSAPGRCRRNGRVAYMEKASKEAKEHTSWVDPDPDYDEALRRFVEGILGDAEFTAALEAFVGPLVEPGRVNSLAQALLKLTSPGVPDIYQGCELWDHTLVDPDNRRPVDYAVRESLLAEAETAAPAEVWPEQADSGLPKLLLTQRALHLRRRRPECFCAGSGYEPLTATGPKAAHASPPSARRRRRRRGPPPGSGPGRRLGRHDADAARRPLRGRPRRRQADLRPARSPWPTCSARSPSPCSSVLPDRSG